MDDAALDRLARALAAAASRRGALGLLLGGPAALAAPRPGAARRRCKRGQVPCGGACCDERRAECRGGGCACKLGFLPCGGACSHPQTEECRRGRVVCKPGHERCKAEAAGGGRWSTCVDTQASTDHCGRCGNPCRAGETCRGGACGGIRAGDECDAADDRCEAGSSCTGSWPDFQWEMGDPVDREPICCLRYDYWGWPYPCPPDSACCGGTCEPYPHHVPCRGPIPAGYLCGYGPEDRCEEGSACTGSWPDFAWGGQTDPNRGPVCCSRYDRVVVGGERYCVPDSACCGGTCEPHPTDPCP